MSKRGALLGGYTLLMVACEDSDLPRVKSLLPSPTLNDKNQSGYSALALCVKISAAEVTKVLIAQGADINSVNNAGQSVLFLACWNNDVQLVKLLLEAGCDTNVADQRGWTPLIIAVYHDYVQVVELLLRYGCNAELRDTFGKRAVDRAHSGEMVSLLQRFAAEKRMQTTNVRINAHLLGQSTPASPTASKASALSSSQVTGPSGRMARSMSLGRGDIHPATVYHALSPKKSQADRRRDLREELERHIQASAISLGARLGDECLSRLQGTLNREIEKVESVLQEEIEALFNRCSKELFRKLKGFVMTLVEDAAADCGFSIPQTHLHEADFNGQVSISKHRTKLKDTPKAKRVYEELADVSDAGRVRVRPPAAHSADLRKDLTDQIGTELQDVSERLERILSHRLTKDLDDRIEQVRGSLSKTATSAIGSLAADLQKNLENLAKTRLAEVVEANKAASHEAASKSKLTPQVSRLNLEKVRQSEAPGRVPPYTEDLGSSQKSPGFGQSEHGAPLSQEDLKVSSGKEGRGRGARRTPPKTKVAESLQRFLENERTLS